MNRPLAAAALAALALPACARAHVIVTPARLEPGTRLVTFLVPNERVSGPRIVRVVARAPRSVRLVDARPSHGWAGIVRDGKVTWSGGSIAPGDDSRFGAVVRIQDTPSRLVFVVDAVPAGSEPERYRVAVDVVDHAGGVSWTTVVAIVAACAFVLAAFFIALSRWLRGSPA